MPRLHPRMVLALAAILPLTQPARAAPPQAVVTQLLSATQTASGQPILLPQGNARVIVSTYLIPPGASLPVHRHPYPRYAYVLAGDLRVTDLDTHQSFDYHEGDFAVEVVNQWHVGANTGTVPLRLLVIDLVPQTVAKNTVAKPH